MPLRITLVRHGRSEANEASIWQGQGNSPLSGEGRAQAAALASRLADQPFDLVVASDLERARATAEALGRPVELDPRFREMDLGGWEGRHFEEVAAEHPDLLEAIRSGEAVRFGGTGETTDEFEARCVAALDDLAARVGEGSVLVATHGGVIDALVGTRLGRVPGRRTFPIVTNTSMTVLRGEGGGG
jgi:glucosyl-3-phosphoglycerate phosphatase